jgi:hypothetical protein
MTAGSSIVRTQESLGSTKTRASLEKLTFLIMLDVDATVSRSYVPAKTISRP